MFDGPVLSDSLGGSSDYRTDILFSCPRSILDMDVHHFCRGLESVTVTENSRAALLVM